MRHLINFFLLIISLTSNGSEMFIIGHRGAAGYQAENTLGSFKKAIELGVDMIEFDVYKCLTGQLVVTHDKTIDRTTTGTGFIDKLSLKQLKNVRTKNNETIPTLQEALNFIDKKVKVNIEIKGDDCEQDLVNIIEEYVENRGWLYSDFLVSSFNHHYLIKIKELNPNINIGILIKGILIDYAACAQKVGAFSINICNEFVTKEYIDDAHKRGLKVFVFTVNDPQEAIYLESLGVDGIFTDYPDLNILCNF